MIRYRRRRRRHPPPHLRGRAAHRPARRRAAPEPAGLDSRAATWCASSRAISRRWRPSRAARRVPLRAARQGDLARALQPATARSSCATRSTPSTPRCAPPSSMLARLLQRHRRVPARRGPGRRAARARARRPARRLGGRDDARAAARAARAHEFVAADYDDAGRPPGRARPLLARPLRRRRRRRTSSSSPAPCPISTASACSPTRKRICEAEIAFWHGSGRAPFERYLFMLNALEDGRGGLEHRVEHGAGRAAARPAAPRRRPSRPRRRRRRPRRATATSACSA